MYEMSPCEEVHVLTCSVRGMDLGIEVTNVGMYV